MSSALLLVGANHKVAPIEIREKLAIPKSRLVEALRQVIAFPEIGETFILSTCNRTEVYVVGDPIAAPARLRAWLSDTHDVPPLTLECCLYEHVEELCAKHLFRVAAGLDSMVLGEVQILGQVREGYAIASEVGTVGKQLDGLLRRAIETGKRARTETGISGHAASISYAAVELARQALGDITAARTLVIGAGEMSELVASTLHEHGARPPIFANRTIERSSELARRYHGEATELHELIRHLGQADIVISSTDAPHYIVWRSMVEAALPVRQGRPLFLIDLAVPRDIEPTVRELPGVYVYNVDALRAIVEANLQDRASEVGKVEQIVAEQLSEFVSWKCSLEVVPTIAMLRQLAEEIRRAELARHAGRLGSLSDDQRQAVDAITASIVNKLLHHPLTRLKAAASNGHGPGYVETVRDLFSLNGKARD